MLRFDPGQDIIPDVGDIREHVRTISRFSTPPDERHILIGKSILAGSINYEQHQRSYTGKITSRREEAVFIEYCLRHAAQEITKRRTADISSAMLPNDELRALLKRHATRKDGETGHKSLTLHTIIGYLGTQAPEYRNGLILFGERVSDRLGNSGTSGYKMPIDVDLNRLDSRRIPLTVRNAYADLVAIEDVVRQFRAITIDSIIPQPGQ